jgi:hypothetical protein
MRMRLQQPCCFAPATTIKTNEATKIYSTPAATSKPVLSNESASSGAMLVPSESTSTSDAVQTQDGSEKAGFLQKTTTWVKANPGKSLLVAGGIITGGVLLDESNARWFRNKWIRRCSSEKEKGEEQN